jgi:hypothetical protein
MTYFFAASIVRAKGSIQSAIYVALCSFAFRSTQKNQRTPEVLVPTRDPADVSCGLFSAELLNVSNIWNRPESRKQK